jgi:hypothetical protein
MRDLIVTENITLDGVIEANGGWFNPAGDDSEIDHSDVEAAFREQSAAADALLLGRLTSEDMRGYWSHRPTTPRASPATSTKYRSTSYPARSRTPTGSTPPCCEVPSSTRSGS